MLNEKIYEEINGQKHYLNIKAADVKNPIILSLHGGPANPDAPFIYEFANKIAENFIFVEWDQRGSGRTYYKNKDRKNKTVSFEQALKDVDSLTDYLLKRFNKDKLIILGHSYGTILGTRYVSLHPEKVSVYIGMGQYIAMKETEQANYEYVYEKLEALGQPLEQLNKAYEALAYDFSLLNLRSFQKQTVPCFKEEKKRKNGNKKSSGGLATILKSPDLSLIDLMWLLKALNLRSHYKLNKELYDFMLNFNMYYFPIEFKVPMYYISGEMDRKCSPKLLKEYFYKITAPKKDIFILDSCGHSPQIEFPQRTAEIINSLI